MKHVDHSGEKDAESGGSDSKGEDMDDVDMDVEVVQLRRKSKRIEKMELEKGKMEYEVVKSRTKMPQIKKKKVVESGESAEVGGSTETGSVVNAADCVDNRHWEMVNGFPHVKMGESSENLKADRDLVKKRLDLFRKFYLQAVQEENKRCEKKIPVEKLSKSQDKVKVGKPKKTDSESEVSNDFTEEIENCNADNGKRKSKRPDIKAIGKMKEANSVLFPESRIGPIPGIIVGDRFFSRAEMCALGFHRSTVSGIDYIGLNNRQLSKTYKLPLAVSVVISGLYEDDKDDLEEVTYTGQGGNNLLGGKQQMKDQELQRGNLALKNCYEQSVPVRVVRGHKHKEGYVGRVYTYDGLYQVLEYVRKRGISGFHIYQFKLRRLGGQPKVSTNQVHYAFGKAAKLFSNIKGLVCKDISMGTEKIPIPATNIIDDTPFPLGFEYHKIMKISKSVNMPTSVTGCNCEGACTDSEVCSCAEHNGFDFPYVQCTRRNKNYSCYRLVEAKDVIFECGPTCGCGPDCVNRASQADIKYRLEVFRTSNKGWAVRSWDYIPSGAPICEYVGILKRTDELDLAQNNDYIFDIDCKQTMKGLDGREKRFRDVSNNIVDLSDQKVDAPEYCIDAGSSGNVARFINHSCEPNLFVQCVLSSHHDLSLARIVLVAAETISPMQELTYDYGYVLDSVVDSEGKLKQLDCYCGEANCRKRLY